MSICKVENCHSFVAKDAPLKGWCPKHYLRWRKHKDVNVMLNPRGLTIEERFSRRIDKSNNCWLWTAHKTSKGYGIFKIGKSCVRAHRFSYELYTGKIPENLYVLHKCDNPSCVNPEHLFVGNQFDNMKDMKLKGRSYDKSGNNHPKRKATKAWVNEGDKQNAARANVIDPK